MRDLLRPVLVPLLLTTPAGLPVSQRSSDLLMRQRMLGLPNDPPHAYDYGHNDDYRSVAEAECIASREAFASWLSRAPVEIGIHTTHIDMTATLLFYKRNEVHQLARGETDPIIAHGFEALCCDAWHAQRKLLTGFPRNESASRLYMTVTVGEHGEAQVDNVFALYKMEEAPIERLHRWTDECRRSWTRVKMEEQEEGSQGAEYINDADDFWAGYSDDEDVGRKSNARGQGDGHASAGQTGAVVGTSTSTTSADQQAALKDILRGAYGLHRSTQRDKTEDESVRAFLELLKNALPANSVL